MLWFLGLGALSSIREKRRPIKYFYLLLFLSVLVLLIRYWILGDLESAFGIVAIILIVGMVIYEIERLKCTACGRRTRWSHSNEGTWWSLCKECMQKEEIKKEDHEWIWDDGYVPRKYFESLWGLNMKETEDKRHKNKKNKQT